MKDEAYKLLKRKWSFCVMMINSFSNTEAPIYKEMVKEKRLLEYIMLELGLEIPEESNNEGDN